MWKISFEQGGISGPDGSLILPSWSDVPDIAQARHVLDVWAADNGVVEQLTQSDGWCPWWYLRFELISDVLFRLLPWARTLLPLRKKFSALDQILVVNPSLPYFGNLLQCLWPGAHIKTTQPHRNRRMLRLHRLTMRTLRAVLTGVQLRRLRRTPARQRVLIVSQDRYVKDGQEVFFRKVSSALETEGLEPVLLIHHHGNSGAATGLKMRWGLHNLAADVLYLRSWKIMASTPKPVKLHAASLMLEGVDFAPIVTQFLEERVGVLVREEEAWRLSFPRILSELQAQAVVLLDENGAEHFVTAASYVAGVPTIAVQHGCIHENHAHYVFPQKTFPEQVPLANYTCVFGCYCHRLLTQLSIYSR